MRPDFTLANYLRLLTSPVYRGVLIRSLEIASVSTVIGLLLAYPVGYTIGFVVPRQRQALLLLLVILPFWTSYIVRTYGWIGFLQKDGFLDSVLSLLLPGRVELGLLYTRVAVIIGFVHVYLPLLILPIYASTQTLDPRLLEASADLGAPPWRTFLRVTLPLTLPGIVAGTTLFFIAVFGSFVTPQLLGGASDLMIGNLIADQFGEAFNWPFGAAMAIVITLVVSIGLFVFFRFARVEQLYG
ncbi:ABC transporter permease [Thermomicrobium sp. 4228-Ro]|uniref:ABC transporter permease n=1 Tax=Thermomicrobium sp. 4228-Ro TaxID=2993937 RepID=UPI002249214F|nr:ABC transporter permease [Thermomicrobium sp. 4228-Ro]MCX2726371.1 ABC transporter permease [Thermomicrobium sp. 4228-Ro]